MELQVSALKFLTSIHFLNKRKFFRIVFVSLIVLLTSVFFLISPQGERASNYYTSGMDDDEDDDIEVDEVEPPNANTATVTADKSTSSENQSSSETQSPGAAHTNRRKQLAKQGSILSNYFSSGPGR